MRPYPLIACIALVSALGGCVGGGGLGAPTSALEQVRTSTFPMARDTWRVSVRSDGQAEREVVERVALYRAAELTVERGFQRFLVQSVSVGQTPRGIAQTLTQTGEVAGAATNFALPGAGGLVAGGTGAIVGGIDRAFSQYGGDLTIKMFAADDPAGSNALDAVEILNGAVNELRRPR